MEIIENRLVVSKKKKPVLVAELRKREYEAFPKVKDAQKAGEDDDIVENDEEKGADEDMGASDFDYLLGVSNDYHLDPINMLISSSCLSGLSPRNALIN